MLMPDSTASSNADASLTMHHGSIVPAIAIASWSSYLLLASRWVSDSVKRPAILLAVVVMLMAIATCVAATWHSSFDPWVTLFCAYVWLFYGALYSWRRLRFRAPHQHTVVLRRGLGYVAIGLGVFLSAILLSRVVPLPQAIVVWLFAVLAAYCVYRVLVLHIEEEDLQVQVNHGVRPPV